MLGLPWTRGPVLTGSVVMLRLPRRADFEPWRRLRQDNQERLQHFEPRWNAFDLTRAGFSARVRAAMRLAELGQSFQFLVFDRRGRHLCGGITLGNVRRGAAQSGQIGYWLGARFEGQGLMSDAVESVARFAFTVLRLQRIEAASIATNTRSVALLTRCGFRREGTCRAYLEIDGRRQDHELYARLPTDPIPTMPDTARQASDSASEAG